MARIGYARVSTADQDLEQQLVKVEGCGIIRSEKMSGGSREGRTELATIIEFLRPGDELVVTRLDRFGRDTRDVLNLIYECEQKGAFVTVLDPHVSTRGEMGHVVLTVLGMVAQMERRFIKERQREGIERAKREGVYRGGKRRVDRDRIKTLHEAGSGPAVIAKMVGCSRMQVYRMTSAGTFRGSSRTKARGLRAVRAISPRRLRVRTELDRPFQVRQSPARSDLATGREYLQWFSQQQSYARRTDSRNA